METGQGDEGNLALNDDENKEALLKFIKKGAPSIPPKEREGKESGERMQYPLRIPIAFFERIKRAALRRDLKTPVNTWITEAILAQLKKEGV